MPLIRARPNVTASPPGGWTLECSQVVASSLEATFDFFADAENLEAITPPFLRFAIETPRPIVIERGARIAYRLRLFGVPIRWLTRIEEYDPPAAFVDVQVHGPYALWRHRHEFRPVAGGTEVRDRVDYRIPLGLLGRAAHALFVRRTLVEIFEYRAAKLVERLG